MDHNHNNDRRDVSAALSFIPEDMALDAIAGFVDGGIAFRRASGRDAFIAAGGMDAIVHFAAQFGFRLCTDDSCPLTKVILGHDDTDDVLAGIAAVSAGVSLVKTTNPNPNSQKG